MGMSIATRSALLDATLSGIDPVWRDDTTAYLAYLQTATPDPADPLATECNYTGYSRTPITKATAWQGTGGSRNNAATFSGGKRTDAGAVQTIQSVAIVDTPSGAITQCLFGALAGPIPVGQNIKPIAEPGTITVTIPA